MSISSLGAGSGLDLAGLVDGLVLAERQGTEFLLNKREAIAQGKLSGFGILKSALFDFRSALQSLNSLSTFQARNASSSNEDAFSVSADSTAVPGKFDVEVQNVAVAQQLISGVQPDQFTDISIGDGGTITIDVNGDSFAVVIGDGSGESTLNAIRDAINDAGDNVGVTASVINSDAGSQLLLESDEPGTSNTITVTVSDNDGNDTDTSGLSFIAGNNLTEERAADDASVSVNGQISTSTSSNVFDSILQGVTITVLDQTTVTETLTVSQNQGGVRDAIQQFVDAYNGLQGSLEALGDYDSEDELAGVLFGDAVVRSVRTQVDRIITDVVADQPEGFQRLAQIGVGFDDERRLQIDSDTLDNALDNNFDAVGSLFAEDGKGVADQLVESLDPFVQFDGIIDTRTDGLQGEIDRITKAREDLARRLESLQERLVSKFSALDSLVANLNSTSAFLTTQLSNLNNLVNSNVNKGG